MGTTYYLLKGQVARIVREAGNVTVELFVPERMSFLEAPGLYGRLLGLTGEPPAEEITAERATALIDADPDLPGTDPHGPAYGCPPPSVGS